MKSVTWDSVNWDQFYWGEPAYVLEPGDPGYEPPLSPRKNKPRKKRKYMASNPTPDSNNELIASGEDFCNGLEQHAAAIGIKQNTFALARAELDALIAAKNALLAAQGAQSPAYAASRSADSNAKGFISRSIKVLSISLGTDWSDAWVATGLPNNSVSVPAKQDDRFVAVGGLKAYFTANPDKENDKLNVTAATATAIYTAVSNGRQGVSNALSNTSTKTGTRDAALEAFRTRYRGGIGELEQILGDDDPKWYDFGLNKPSDPATPGVPDTVNVTALGGGRVLVQIGGVRRANSHSFYRKLPTDAEPVKVINTEGTQHTIEGLPAGATVQFTVTGVNDAGEGRPSEPVSVVVT
jgi:hypothetical protein